MPMPNTEGEAHYEEVRKTVADRIEAAGLTITEVALLAGLTKQFLSDALAGNRPISSHRAQTILQAVVALSGATPSK